MLNELKLLKNKKGSDNPIFDNWLIYALIGASLLILMFIYGSKVFA